MISTSSFSRDANQVPITGLGLTATKSITYAAATTGATGATTLFTVTGAVAIRIFAECTSDLTSGGAATIEVGISGNTAALIAQTTATGIDSGEIWLDTAAATVEALPGQFILVGGTDIIQTIASTTITGGVLTYYCLWEPISSDGNVVAT
jgi:hypothetical protein